MKKFYSIFSIAILIAASLIQPYHVVEAASDSPYADNNISVSPTNYINNDGTLKLDANVSGIFDLQGWNVQIDHNRGPVFATKNGQLNSSMPFTSGEWVALGSNLAGNDGALNNGVNAVAVDGTSVYVGGGFTDAGGVATADYIAKWDGANWSGLGSNGTGNGSLNNFVGAIVATGGNVYVGGDFTNVNNNGVTLGAADYIVKWNGSSWSALGNNGAGEGSLNNSVLSITVDGTSVYVGGVFQNVNNNGVTLGAADYIAKWNGSNWLALGSNGAANGSLNDVVADLAVSNSNLYVGGGFTNVNNGGTMLSSADYIAKWDGTNWSALGSNGAGDGSLNQIVLAVAASNGNVYAGGWFADVNNNGTILTKADRIAKFDGTNWSALDHGGDNGGISVAGHVDEITVSGNDVFVGGHFGLAGSMPGADAVAKWDGTNWWPLGNNGTSGGSLTNDVLAIAVSNGTVYVGGLFANVNNYGTVLWNADSIAAYQDVAPLTISGNVGTSGTTFGFPTSSASRVDGSYSFRVPYKWNGTIYPTHPCYTFSPDNRPYSGITTNQMIQNYTPILNPASGCAEINVAIAGDNQGKFGILPGASTRAGFSGIDNGPVKVQNATSAKTLAALRVIWKEPGYRSSYSEMMGLPVEQLSSEYWFPWYNNLDTSSMDQGFRIANVDAADTTIKVMLGTTELDSFSLTAGASVRKSYDVNNGPIRIFSEEGNNILAALRVIWLEPSSRFSYSEMMGLPVEQLSDEYWFPWYNNAVPSSMDQGFRIANVDTASSNTVEVWVGTTQLDTIVLGAGASTRVGYSVDNGPIRIVCSTCTNIGNDKIIAALRVIWKEPGFRASYSEMMGLPKEQLSNQYWFPWYNNAVPASMDQGFRIANVSSTEGNTVEVWVGSTKLATLSLAAGGSTRVGYNVDNGPIRIVCTTCTNLGSDKILTALRVIWKEPGYRSSYSEMMGLPHEALSTEYWFPWYNFAAPNSMDQGFRIAVP